MNSQTTGNNSNQSHIGKVLPGSRGRFFQKSPLAARGKRFFRFIRQHPWKSLARLVMVWLVIVLILGIAIYFEVKDRIHLVSPEATPFIEDFRGKYISEGWGSDSVRGYWEIDGKIPQRVEACFIAVEDRRFYSHHGIDWRAVGRAIYNNIFGGSRHGASTIAMQVARMQYSLDGNGKRTYWKKCCEVVIARLLISKYGRERVLRHYLRIVPMGNRIHGVSYAARRYFRKPLQDLGWAEAALLAALPKAPGDMNIFNPRGFARAVDRARLVLDLVLEQGQMSIDEYNVSIRHLRKLQPPVREERPFHAFHAIRVMEEWLRIKGVKVYCRPVRSSLDLELQFYLTQVASRAMFRYRALGAGNIAIIVAERKTGKVRGYLGSEYYYDEVHSGAINYARTPRSAGSTLKPFIYALGLEDGKFSPASVLPDLPFYITHSSGQYLVCNYDQEFLGPMLYRKALANSRNSTAVRVLQAIGVSRVHDFFSYIHLERSQNPASHYGLGLAVGGLYVTLEDLVQSYGIIANGGNLYRLSWYEEEPRQGMSFADDGKTSEQRVLSEDVCRQVTMYLSDPLSRLPSFPRMGPLEYPFPVAVKTGTSQGFRDAWTLAWSEKYIVGVWLGHPNNDRMNRVNGAAAAEVVKQVMMHLHPGENYGIGETPFLPPRGYEAVKTCTLSGQRAHDSCSDVMLEYFKPGTEPVSECRVHLRFAVNRETGKAADRFTSPGKIEMRTFTVLPPEYAAWAAGVGIEKAPVLEGGVLQAVVEIRNPVDQARLMVDPETPLKFQTLPLRAKVTPQVSYITWVVDGIEQEPTPYPYELRWQLKPGEHTFQARFPHANVFSQTVRVIVTQY